MANIEKYRLVSGKRCAQAVNDNTEYKVFWRSGFAFRGATEHEVKKETAEVFCHPYFDANGNWHNKKVMTFDEQMQQKYKWAATIDLTIDHDRQEIHMNGFSCLDME